MDNILIKEIENYLNSLPKSTTVETVLTMLHQSKEIDSKKLTDQLDEMKKNIGKTYKIIDQDSYLPDANELVTSYRSYFKIINVTSCYSGNKHHPLYEALSYEICDDQINALQITLTPTDLNDAVELPCEEFNAIQNKISNIFSEY